MHQSIETESQELRRHAAGILDLLSRDATSIPNYNRRALDEVRHLGAMWHSHLKSLARAAEFISSNDTHFRNFLTQFEKDAVGVTRGLDKLGSAHDAPDSVVLQIREAVAEALRLVYLEQSTVIPLVRRWRSTRSASPVRSPGTQQGPVVC